MVWQKGQICRHRGLLAGEGSPAGSPAPAGGLQDQCINQGMEAAPPPIAASGLVIALVLQIPAEAAMGQGGEGGPGGQTSLGDMHSENIWFKWYINHTPYKHACESKALFCLHINRNYGERLRLPAYISFVRTVKGHLHIEGYLF